MSLEALLDKAAHSRIAARGARHLLGLPWCVPTEGHPLHAAARRVTTAPARRAPGEVLLVSVDDGAAPQGSLWLFGRGRQTPLEEEAQAAWRNARHVVFRDLGGWRLRTAARPTPLLAEWLASTSGLTPHRLTGPSYGAAMVLSLASSGLGVPVPGDLAALAALDARGGLVRVDGLEAKLRVLREWAPGVRRVVIAAGQREEAARWAAGLELLEVRAANDLVDLAFGPWVPVDLEEESRRLYLLALRSDRPLVTWSRVAAAARTLRDSPVASAAARSRAEIAETIALRHEGRPAGELPPVPPGETLPRALAERYEAHRVQQLMDAGQPDGGLVERLFADRKSVV